MTLLRARSLASSFLLATLFLGCHGTPPSTAAATAPPAAKSAAPVAVAPKKTTIERVIELGRTDNHVQEHLRHLCLDIGPRLTGSTALHTACEWTRDQFKSWGLDARLETWGDFPVGFDRGPWTGGIAAPVEVKFEFHTMAWTPGTNGPKRGKALPFPTTDEELAEMEDELAGAWVVRPPGAALQAADGTNVFEKPKQPSNDLIKKVQDAMIAKGALGEVRGARSELLVTAGNHQITWTDLPKLVQVRVRRDQHDDLWARMTKGEPVELAFDVDNRFVQGPVPQYNVVADLVGSEKPDEYVIVGGHLDSWDGAQGTVDNGTGSATTLEAARLLMAAGAKPKRTIRFMLWSGEEQGLFGSEFYVKEHPDLMPKISAVLVHDEGTNYLSGLGVTAAMMPAMQTACAPVLGLNPAFPFELKQIDGLPNFVGSDNDSFTQANVPGLFWNQAGRSDYEHYHHTQFDTFEAAIPEYQEHSAIVVALTALGVADLPELLDRKEMKAPEPRRMGVDLDGTKITGVRDGSKAKEMGLLVGDVILTIDGEEMRNQGSISGALRGGGSQKVVQVKRGTETLSVTFDWSNDPDEPRRLEAALKRAAEETARKAERDAKKAAESPATGAPAGTATEKPAEAPK